MSHTLYFRLEHVPQIYRFTCTYIAILWDDTRKTQIAFLYARLRECFPTGRSRYTKSFSTSEPKSARHAIARYIGQQHCFVVFYR